MEPSKENMDKIKANINKILIADASSFTRIMLKNILKQTDFEVGWEASSGKEAVELFKENLPGLTLLSVDMPEIDGIEALEQIKEYSPSSYVVMLDSSHSQEIYQRCANAYANGILYKPFKSEEVIKAVKDLLSPGWDWSV